MNNIVLLLVDVQTALIKVHPYIDDVIKILLENEASKKRAENIQTWYGMWSYVKYY